MTESDALAEGFEQNRTRLRAVAYRMLGSLAEADDAVQETWLRLSRSDASGVDNLGAWLTTIIARVSLNVLRSRRTQREEPMGVHVPDPVISPADGTNPEEQALLADSVGLALQVVLDTLTPAERLAFVLHDLFDLPFDEIAPIVGRSAATTRQLASRARRRVRGAEVSRGRIAEIDILADPERLRRADLAVLGGPALGCGVGQARGGAGAVPDLPARQAQPDAPGDRVPAVRAFGLGRPAGAVSAAAGHRVRRVRGAGDGARARVIAGGSRGYRGWERLGRNSVGRARRPGGGSSAGGRGSGGGGADGGRGGGLARLARSGAARGGHGRARPARTPRRTRSAGDGSTPLPTTAG